MAVTTIGEDPSLFTVIFEFNLPSFQRQTELSEIVQRLVKDIVRHQAGFVSSNLHLSTDGAKIFNYLQWRRQEDFLRFNNQESKRIKPVLQTFGPVAKAYEIIDTTTRGGMVARIDPKNEVFTVIFDFDVEPRNQVILTPRIEYLVANVVSKQPGFLTSNLHRSFDGTKVLNYLQFESGEHFARFKANEAAQSQIRPRVAPFGPKPRAHQVVACAHGDFDVPPTQVGAGV